MTSVSANYGFVSSGDPDHNIVAGTGFYAGNYTITLDIVNYLVDISPKASTMAAEINSYPSGDISTPECATKYAAIKPKVTNLSDSEKTIFETSSDVDIANARARYTHGLLQTMILPECTLHLLSLVEFIQLINKTTGR